jgi:hypothetical protein
MMQREEYILEWLDTTVNFSLNPNRNTMHLINESQIQTIQQRLLHEADQQKRFLERGVLCLYSRKKIHVFINQYHNALLSVLNQSHANILDRAEQPGPILDICNAVTKCIEQIMEFLKIRFQEFFTSQRPIPYKYILELKTEIKSRTDIIRSQFERTEYQNPLCDILLKVLYKFCLQNSDYVGHQQALYFKELVDKTEIITATFEPSYWSRQIENTLIQLNFNDPGFITYITQSIATKINGFQTRDERLSSLREYRKEFVQLSITRNQGLIVDGISLKKSVGNWFKQEAQYLESINGNPAYPISNVNIAVKPVKQPAKIMCLLSVDQMAIILRAMDALRIIQAKSMSVIFETIVPFLSTPQRSDLSWQSMRNKSYAFEEHDRKAAIDTLESMIKFIREA